VTFILEKEWCGMLTYTCVFWVTDWYFEVRGTIKHFFQQILDHYQGIPKLNFKK